MWESRKFEARSLLLAQAFGSILASCHWGCACYRRRGGGRARLACTLSCRLPDVRSSTTSTTSSRAPARPAERPAPARALAEPLEPGQAVPERRVDRRLGGAAPSR